MDKILLSVDDAALALSIGRTEIFRLISSGELSSLKVGRRRLIPARALEAWVATRMANATRTEPTLANGDGPNQSSERVTASPLVGLREVV